MKTALMDETCANAVGKLLFAHPAYGYGWSGNPGAPLPPKVFAFVLDELWRDGDGRIGAGIGTITEAGHEYVGWRFVFSPRHVAHYDFEGDIGYYTVFITRTIAYHPKGGPYPGDGKEGCCGYAEVGLKAALDQHRANLLRRKSISDKRRGRH